MARYPKPKRQPRAAPLPPARICCSRCVSIPGYRSGYCCQCQGSRTIPTSQLFREPRPGIWAIQGCTCDTCQRIRAIEADLFAEPARPHQITRRRGQDSP